jgi:transketolase
MHKVLTASEGGENMPVSDRRVRELEELAYHSRKRIVSMICKAGSGHPGGSLSALDIITALYFEIMQHDPKRPQWEDRDRFVLSKGHAAPALYATLAEAGYFPVEELDTLRQIGSRLQGHPDMKRLPGIEMSTGSLGQGLATAVGMALGLQLDKRTCRVYCMIGDGESEEGAIWEAGMAAKHFKCDNLAVFLDRNELQIDGPTEKVMTLEPLADKWTAFGWNVIQINGHDFKSIIEAVDAAKERKGRPTMIIAHTVKGKGVSFMEGSLKFHGKAPSEEELCKALEDLEKFRGCSE